jgi:hypothetical protein
MRDLEQKFEFLWMDPALVWICLKKHNPEESSSCFFLSEAKCCTFLFTFPVSSTCKNCIT